MIAAIYARKSTWIGAAICFGVICGVAAGVGTAGAAQKVSAWATGINAGLLAATFVAILWYSIQTRRLVDAQERSTEIDKHPWLLATTLDAQWLAAGDDFPLGGEHLWLPIKNSGVSPAFKVQVHAAYAYAVEGHAVESEKSSRQVTGQLIVPNDTLLFEIGRVTMRVPGARAQVDVSVAYTTSDGGHGSLTVQFISDTPRGWRNGPTSYSFWLSNGGEYGDKVG